MAVKRGKKKRPRTYTPAEKVKAIIAYVWAGTTSGAAEATGLPQQRIWGWVNKNPEAVAKERERMLEEFRGMAYAARQAYLANLLNSAASANVQSATGALKELNRTVSNLEGTPTERIEVHQTIEQRLKQIEKERGVEEGDDGDDAEGDQA